VLGRLRLWPVTETNDPGRSLAESDAMHGAARLVEAAATAYVDASALRAAVSLIPGVGGALDVFISGEGARIEKRRLAKLIEDLQLEMALIDASKLDRDFIGSPEGYDWFRLLAERVVRTSDENKLAALRRVYAQGVTVEHSRGALKEIILRHVGDMTGAHVAVLHYLTMATRRKFDSPLVPEGAVNPVELATARISVDGVSASEFDAIIIDLLQMSILDYHPPFGSWDVDRKQVLLTRFGWDFVGFLRS